MTKREEITSLLGNVDPAEAPKPPGQSRLFELMYPELHSLAGRLMHRERPNHTLQATAIVHEAYLLLVDQTRISWQGRTHFDAVASKVMRRLLREHARSRNTQKRGLSWRRVTLSEAVTHSNGSEVDLIDFEDIIAKLEHVSPFKAQIAGMKLVAGMSSKEIADATGTSTRTIERHWRFARAWLLTELVG